MREEPTYDELLRQYRRAELENEESRDRARRRRRVLSPSAKAFAVLLALVIMATGALATVVLFTNTAPPVNFPTQAVTSACSASTLYAYQVNGVQGGAAYALFSCAGGVALTGQGGMATSSSVALGGWSNVYIFSNTTGAGTNCANSMLITTGSNFNFVAGQAYNYCAVVATAGASASGFIVAWSQ